MLTVALAVLASTSGRPEINVAAASNGGRVFADSEFIGSTFDPGGVAPASRLIDGVIRKKSDPGAINRWHSELSKPHPHWAAFKFAAPAKVSRVVLWRADIGSPVDVEGQWSPDHGKTVHTLFKAKGLAMDDAHPTAEFTFNPVVTDNFRLVITRSSNPDFPNYTQLSEVEVFGEPTRAPQPAALPQRKRGPMVDRPMPKDLHCQTTEQEIAFTSPWLRVAFPLSGPGMSFLSLDTLGGGNHKRNFLKSPRGIDVFETAWDDHLSSENVSFEVSRIGNVVRYTSIRGLGLVLGDLTFTAEPKGLKITFDCKSSAPLAGSPLRALFDEAAAVSTPLGSTRKPGVLEFPLLLHVADRGTLLVSKKGPDATWNFAGNRPGRTVELALSNPPKGSRVELDMRMTEIYPERAVVDADPKLVGVRRAWLNMFGFRPDLPCLSNNVISDQVLFCMYEYADHAMLTPKLFDDFTALDLVRASLDYYFDGGFGYGNDRDVFQDSDPSMVIASWDYATGKNDTEWLRRRIKNVEFYADHVIACDRDGDGLPEAKRTGNSGSGIDGAGEWSSNWWDVVSFGHNDAYTIALDYRAFRCMADLERRLGNQKAANMYADRARRIKDVYYKTFYNPETGILAGWKSKDGQLHDYWFTFVNGIAVCYGLVTPEQANPIMDRILAKMKEVGYTNFKIGLPGNLVPVALKDYAGGGVLGQPRKADGSDSFQSYENGGATAGFAYFTVQALYSLGRKADADRIFDAMLEGYRDGVYQDGIGSGVDWKRWDGTPCGYEGLLTDSYYALRALITGKMGRGVHIP